MYRSPRACFHPHVSFACTRCRARCDLRGGVTVLFHAPSGDGGVVCSPACAAAMKVSFPDLAPVLDATTHRDRARASLQEAHATLRRAAGAASDALMVPVANAVLFAASAGVRLVDHAAGQRNGVVLAEAGRAARPIQQAVLHMSALGAWGVSLGDHVAKVAGCDVDRLSTDVDVAGDQCEAMAKRLSAAIDALNVARL